MFLSYLVVSFLPLPQVEAAFTASEISLQAVEQGAAAWGDYNNDGYPDVVITGRNGSVGVTTLYTNLAGSLSASSVNLTGVYNSAAAWGDYNNDGYLDLALSGSTGTDRVLQIYRNDGSGSFAMAVTLTGVEQGGVAWGDVDGDGDLDVVASGTTTGAAAGATLLVFQQTGGLFAALAQSAVTGVRQGTVVLADFDLDGDLDLAAAGSDTAGAGVTKLYINDGNGVFADPSPAVSFVNVDAAAAAWADFDGDGDPDLAVAGTTTTRVCRLYKNTTVEGIVTLVEAATLTGVQNGALSAGDLNNDGSMDLVVVGLNTSGVRSVTVLTNAGSFSFLPSLTLTGLSEACSGLADVDGDGDLDLLAAGRFDNPAGDIHTVLYLNSGVGVNAAPSVPTELAATMVGGIFTVKWSAAADDLGSPQYQVRIGTTPGGHEFSTGVYGQFLMGSHMPTRVSTTQLGRKYSVFPSNQVVYWAVRAIDAGLRPGAWSEELAFYTGGLLFAANPQGLHIVKGRQTSLSSGVVKNAAGEAVGGVPVKFTVTRPDGSVKTYTASTNLAGIASYAVASDDLTQVGTYTVLVEGNGLSLSGSSSTFYIALAARPPVTVAPNPFTPTKAPWNRAAFVLETEPVLPVTLVIFDLGGRVVREAVFPPSTNIEWDGRDNPGNLAEGGIYFWKLTADGAAHTGTVILHR